MKILFIHPRFPGQFSHLAQSLAGTSEILFATARNNPELQLEGVKKVFFSPPNVPPDQLAPIMGEAVLRLLQDIRDKEGFIPDIICGQAGRGATLFVKDIFPATPFLGYFDWYNRGPAQSPSADADNPLPLRMMATRRWRNSPTLQDLVSCDAGIVPTRWQLRQFPEEFHGKFHILHDGIDLNTFKPAGQPVVPSIPELNLPAGTQLVTFFPDLQAPRAINLFMEMVPQLQATNPQCHIVVAGIDNKRPAFQGPEGKPLVESLIDKFAPDRSKLHFIDRLSPDQHLLLLQSSDVYVQITPAFTHLSRTFFEAMACGCVVVASDTPPVREVVEDGANGILADIRVPGEIARKINGALTFSSKTQTLRERARITIEKKFSLAELLPRHLQVIAQFAEGKHNNGPFG